MREINNNNNNIDVTKLQKPELKPVNAEVEQVPAEETKASEIKDFSNPTEILGRSQVSSADNLKSDVAFASAHPEVLSRSDKLFEIAFKGLMESNDPNAYEKACAIATSEDAKGLLTR